MESILARAEQLGIQVAFEAISRIDSDAYCSLSETAEFIGFLPAPLPPGSRWTPSISTPTGRRISTKGC